MCRHVHDASARALIKCGAFVSPVPQTTRWQHVAGDWFAKSRALAGGAGPGGRARPMIKYACALCGGVVGRAGSVLTLCGSQSADELNDPRCSYLLVPRWKCRRTPEHTPTCVKGVEGAGG